jgi:hypothetical protein
MVAFFDQLFHVTLAHLQKSSRESTEHLDLFILFYTNTIYLNTQLNYGTEAL